MIPSSVKSFIHCVFIDCSKKLQLRTFKAHLSQADIYQLQDKPLSTSFAHDT
ncbi:MAG: hypothetical protein JRH20_17360 [Deltaproteobacteria bacterium]|nr:hypothetical protein [Deltaproteobacteria bacterium]